MLGNIVDERTNKYWIDCHAVFEPPWADNTCKEATQFPQPEWSNLEEWDDLLVASIEKVTVAEAIQLAENRWPCPVTVYLYDPGDEEELEETLMSNCVTIEVS